MKYFNELYDSTQVVAKTGDDRVKIKGVTDDSRDVREGYLFVAIKGLTVDGHDYIEHAIKNGAAAVVAQKQLDVAWKDDVSYLQVKDSREALGFAASSWNDFPTKKLKVIGVTGTKGKSTTVHILHHLMAGGGKNVGSMTSISAKIADEELSTGLHVTNPGPLELHKLLRKMVENKCEYALLEITSHGLDQKRVAGVEFHTAVMTNISHEHLDYHRTFTGYIEAKAKLFAGVDRAVLNKDDRSFSKIKQKLDKNVELITYSLESRADYKASYVDTNEFMNFTIRSKGTLKKFTTRLIGDYNILNFAAAIAIARDEGISWNSIEETVNQVPLPPGRLERINNELGINIYIDFAHTPDSLEKVLKYLKGLHPKGELIPVFGCASERDVQKRPKMGEISTRLADISVFTAEDPRSEDINKIIDEIETGVTHGSNRLDSESKIKSGEHYYIRVPERIDAIAASIRKYAKPGDTVVICGKGHEESMSYEGLEHPWSDKKAILSALQLNNNKAAVVLAAGKGTRLKGEDAKVLRKIAGRPMITYVVSNLIKSGFGNVTLVVGYKKEQVIKRTQGFVDYVVQEEQLGTGHALKCSLNNIPEEVRDFIVLNGDDSAFFYPDTINKIYKEHIDEKAVVSFVSLVVDDPTGLGRVVKDENGQLTAIVEEKDASDKQKKVNEVNDGFYVFNKDFVQENIIKVQKSRISGEYYIVDLVKLALEQGKKVHVHTLKDNNEWHGINTVEQLEEGDRKMRIKIEKFFSQ